MCKKNVKKEEETKRKSKYVLKEVTDLYLTCKEI